jgi:hypothetical protein
MIFIFILFCVFYFFIHLNKSNLVKLTIIQVTRSFVVCIFHLIEIQKNKTVKKSGSSFEKRIEKIIFEKYSKRQQFSFLEEPIAV